MLFDASGVMGHNDDQSAYIGSWLNGKVMAVAQFRNVYARDGDPISVEVHFDAYERMIPRELLKAGGRYAFRQLGCKRMQTAVAEDNDAIIKLAEWLGFRVEGRARRAHDGIKDQIIMGCLSQEYRFNA